jgi:hypothetical protein
MAQSEEARKTPSVLQHLGGDQTDAGGIGEHNLPPKPPYVKRWEAVLCYGISQFEGERL